MSRLQHGICGSLNPGVRDEDNPHLILRDPLIQELLLDVAHNGPFARRRLYDNYGGPDGDLGNLFHNGLLRDEDGKVWINFTLLTAEDHRMVWLISQKYGRVLADAVAQREPGIRRVLSDYSRSQVSVEKLAFITVGCFVLDNEGLRLLNELGYVRSAREQHGGSFTVWALERAADLELKGLYWGGHTDLYEDLLFTSFGDHFSLPRRVLPDVLRQLYQVSGFVDSDETREILHAFRESLGGDLARVLRGVAGAGLPEELRCGASVDSLVRWLTWLGYIGEDGLAIPYFTAEDRPMLRELKETVTPQIAAWCQQHYRPMMDALAECTPLRHGVAYAEVFTQVWHHLFGWANRHLADMGVIFNTYEPQHPTPGCIAALAERSALYEQ